MSEIYPAILAHTFEEYTARLELIEGSSSKWVHVDFMDGQFVPNISVMPYEIMSLNTRLTVEAHLMTYNPERYYSDLSVIGCGRVLLHRECYDSLESCRTAVKNAQDYFEEVGLVYNISTPIESVQALGLSSLMLMGIDPPGQTAQPLLEAVFDRLKEARKLNPQIILAVDGGVSDQNLKELQKSGAQRFVISSHIFVNNAVPQNLQYFTQLLTGGV